MQPGITRPYLLVDTSSLSQKQVERLQLFRTQRRAVTSNKHFENFNQLLFLCFSNISLLSRTWCKYQMLAKNARDIGRVVQTSQQTFECLNVNRAVFVLLQLLQRGELAFKVDQVLSQRAVSVNAAMQGLQNEVCKQH